MTEWISSPWPWYVAGPLLGLTVPLLLWLDNRRLGISGVLRHVCAAVLPARVPFFQYNWRSEIWNLFMALGIIAGGWVASFLLTSTQPFDIAPDLLPYLQQKNLTHLEQGVPVDLFSWSALGTWRGWCCMVLGGWLVGFGTRYAGGCTSGHAISGISQLQWPSLLATCCFMVGGIVASYFILPFIL